MSTAEGGDGDNKKSGPGGHFPGFQVLLTV
jgi:hypothetical protein